MKTLLLKSVGLVLVGAFVSCKTTGSRKSAVRDATNAPYVSDGTSDQSAKQVDEILGFMEASLSEIYRVQSAIVENEKEETAAAGPKSIDASALFGVEQLLSSVQSLQKIFQDNGNEDLQGTLAGLQKELENAKLSKLLTFAPSSIEQKSEGLALGGYGQPAYGHLRAPTYVRPQVYTVRPTYVTPPVYQVPVYVNPQPVYQVPQAYPVQPVYPQPSYYFTNRKVIPDTDLYNANQRLLRMQSGYRGY